MMRVLNVVKKGHFKKDCFKWKAKKASGSKEKKKSKALLTWSDDESDVKVDTDDELAQLCLAGIEEVSSDDEEVHSVTIPSNSEIPKDLLALQVQNRKLRDKNAYLKKALNEVLSEMDDSLKEESYAIENKLLSEKLVALSKENVSLKSEINKKDYDLAALREEANSVSFREEVNQVEEEKDECYIF